MSSRDKQTKDVVYTYCLLIYVWYCKSERVGVKNAKEVREGRAWDEWVEWMQVVLEGRVDL